MTDTQRIRLLEEQFPSAGGNNAEKETLQRNLQIAKEIKHARIECITYIIQNPEKPGANGVFNPRQSR